MKAEYKGISLGRGIQREFFRSWDTKGFFGRGIQRDFFGRGIQRHFLVVEYKGFFGCEIQRGFSFGCGIQRVSLSWNTN